MSLLIWNERHFDEACDEFEYRVSLVLKQLLTCFKICG
jgi:hypothetical protein